MTNYLWRWRVVATHLAVAMICILVAAPQPSVAGTTGTIAGVVSDSQTGAPIANALVGASSPSGSQSTRTNGAGFFSLQQLIPDTYTVSVQAQGYDAASIPGITVQQDLVARADTKLSKTLKTIASVTSRSAGNLVKPYEGTDVYNVSGQQLNAATGGDNLHRTVYEYLATVPGVTPIGGGFPAEPSIRGGYDVDNGYELDGIPITERVTGFFTTNLTDLGIQNVEVYTGGLGASNAGNGMGIINSVIKSGTYPGFRTLSLGITGPDYNHYVRAEVGGATIDKRYSWYLAFDGANSQNTYWTNNAQPGFDITSIGIGIANPGYIYTRDLIGNFHYKPNDRNDFQFFYQNSLYDEKNNYGLNGPSQAFGLAPCPGAIPDTTRSNASGGIAPNGQTCPLGLYLTPIPSGEGNRTGHYSGIGKLQWNHIINDHSSFSFRLAENFNQYIFNQPYSDPNSPANNGAVSSGCPNYPYAIGGPLPAYHPDATHPLGTRECTFDLGDYWQSRRAHQYYASIDYSNILNENVSYKMGVGQEYDYSIRDVRYLNLFDYPGAPRRSCYGEAFSFPCHNAFTDIPTHVPYFYAQGSFNLKRWTFQPGIRLSSMFYAFPAYAGGPHAVNFIAPSILGTYRMNPSNVVRFSYAESGQFIGTEFAYRLNSFTYNPGKNGEKALQPMINHVTDLMLEHQFNADTSVRIGPYYRATNNYLGIFTPFLGFTPGGAPKYGDPELKSGLKIRSFGAEFGLSHLDRHASGVSYWVSASYNNYWTQVSDYTGGQASFINFPLPDNFLQQGVYVRGYQVPLLSATLTMDLHKDTWHFLPVVYYSVNNFYNTGACQDPTVNPPFLSDCQSAASDTGAAPVLGPRGAGAGYWLVNATLAKDLGQHYSVGVRVSNLTNNQHGTTPCWNANAVDPTLSTGMGNGCAPFNGPHSQFSAPVGYIYQPVTQDPRRVEGFVNIKF